MYIIHHYFTHSQNYYTTFALSQIAETHLYKVFLKRTYVGNCSVLLPTHSKQLEVLQIQEKQITHQNRKQEVMSNGDWWNHSFELEWLQFITDVSYPHLLRRNILIAVLSICQIELGGRRPPHNAALGNCPCSNLFQYYNLIKWFKTSSKHETSNESESSVVGFLSSLGFSADSLSDSSWDSEVVTPECLYYFQENLARFKDHFKSKYANSFWLINTIFT